jgi:hypothetical protein
LNKKKLFFLIKILYLDELNILKPVNNIETPTNVQSLLSNQFSRM